MKTDRELLELAARAAGIAINPVEIKNVEFAGDDRFIGYSTDPYQWQRGWFNPLTDDGDALRLAVKLKLEISVGMSLASELRCRAIFDENIGASEPAGNDHFAATRRAIVSAAAAIGESIK
jgi:hypothetical protein